MICDGRNGGTVEVLDNVLIIRRKGVASFLTQGLKGEKRIPFSSITSVQFKEPGMTTGYIQFGILGGTESRGGVFDATKDENTVLFGANARDEFVQLRDLVEARIGRPADGAPSAGSATGSLSDELTRLADLRDRGVLTDDEFAQEKARLLGQRSSATIPAPSRLAALAGSPGPATTEPDPEQVDEPKSTVGKKLGIGCVTVAGIFIGLSVIGSIVGTQGGSKPADATSSDKPADTPTGANPVDTTAAPAPEEDAGRPDLTGPQSNAARSAEQYLSFSGFSREGLIDQLSSSAGNGYSVADATVAVDSLTVDWNENAAKSAKQYLSMSGFSCSGLIEQLSSSAGNKYTVSQATYGAHQAGAC